MFKDPRLVSKFYKEFQVGKLYFYKIYYPFNKPSGCFVCFKRDNSLIIQYSNISLSEQLYNIVNCEENDIPLKSDFEVTYWNSRNEVECVISYWIYLKKQLQNLDSNLKEKDLCKNKMENIDQILASMMKSLFRNFDFKYKIPLRDLNMPIEWIRMAIYYGIIIEDVSSSDLTAGWYLTNFGIALRAQFDWLELSQKINTENYQELKTVLQIKA
jgi:hypothetical protein